MSLVSVVYHLLISPLSKLGISWVVIWGLSMHLPLAWVSMELVLLLVVVLVKGGVILLLRVGRLPSCLLLLNRIRVRLLADWGGRCRVFVRRRRALSWQRGVDCVGRRVH